MSTYRKIRLALVALILLGLLISRLLHFGHKSGTDNDKIVGSSAVLTGSSNDDGTPGAKVNAYVEAANQAINWEHFDHYIDETKKEIAVLNRPGPIKDFSYPGSGEVDQLLEKLHKASSQKASIPEIDSPAAAFQDSLEKLNPLMKQATAYSKSKQYLTDNGAEARKFEEPLLAALEQTDKTSDAFADALHDYKFKRDEARLGSLKQGSLEYLTLDESLQARRTSEALRAALHDPSQIAMLDTSIDGLVQRNNALGSVKIDTSSDTPKWDAGCKMYKSQMDTVIGKARAVSNDLKHKAQVSGADGNEDVESYFTEYNNGVGKLNDCAE